VSGFPGYDENAQVPKGDFAAQMRLTMKSVKATLEYAGSSLEKLAKVNIYLDRRAEPQWRNPSWRVAALGCPSGVPPV